MVRAGAGVGSGIGAELGGCVGFVWCGRGGFDLAAGTGAGVDQFGGLECLQEIFVAVVSVGLQWGDVVPIESEPGEVFDGLLASPGFGAWGIEIFDTQGDVTVFRAEVEPSDEEGACVTEVLCAGGGRGESTTR